IEILFLLAYIATLLAVWFKRVFKTDDDAITHHHVVHQKNLKEQQEAAMQGMLKSCPKTVGSLTQRLTWSEAQSRLAQRAPPSQCTVTPLKLCLEGWICDSSSISVSGGQLHCTDGSAILV
ncbi:hypothetical protein PFISCL1PPCAC_19389, partial [Pristionchus fissidentatus]